MATADYHGIRPESVMPRTNMDRYNLVARFRDMAAASRAVAELKQLGFSDEDVSVLGSAADIVDTNTGVSVPEGKVVRSTARDAVLGVVAGAIIGAIVGIIVLAILKGAGTLGAHVSAGGWIAAALFGAIIGLTLGGLVGGVAGLDRGQAGVPTYGPNVATGAALVGVHAEQESQLSSASGALHAAGALDVERNAPSGPPAI